MLSFGVRDHSAIRDDRLLCFRAWIIGNLDSSIFENRAHRFLKLRQLNIVSREHLSRLLIGHNRIIDCLQIFIERL